MTGFYSIRLSKHLKKMMKYMRYVFNDHFILVCVFLLGGLGFYYSETLKTLPADFIWGRSIVAVIWFVTLLFGKVATLAEEADKVFILPKEPEMKGYLLHAVRYSFWLPLITLLLVTGLTMPLVVISTGWSFSTFFLYLATVACLKISHLFLLKYELYQISASQRWMWFSLWSLTSLLVIFGGLYLSPYLGVVLGAIQLAFFKLFLEKQAANVSLDWEGMIQKEKNRMHRIYQFIHLFTDVPEITSSVKRRKIFDPLLNRIKKTTSNTYFYLYGRSFVRGSEYSGLFIRLVLVGGVILFFLKEFWVSLGVSALFIYLIGFQLIPIYARFDYMIMTHLYPIPRQQKKQAVSRLITWLLLVAVILFSVLVIIALPKLSEVAIIIGVLVTEVIFFSKMYVPYRLKKMEG